MTQGDEKFYRWLNAYLDGTLTDEQRARFEALIDRDPAVRQRIALHHNIESSMRRLFVPDQTAPAAANTTVAAQPGPVGSRSGAATTKASPARKKPGKPKSGGRVFRRVLALAAMLVIAAGSWVGWKVWSASEQMAAFYESSKQSNFKEDWRCEDEREFQTTFWAYAGAGVTLAEAQLPKSARMMGLKYSTDPNDSSVYLMGKVDDRGVIVRVTKKENALYDYVFTHDLAGFRKDTDHLTMIEITPFEKPYFLDAMSETDLPEAWKKEPKLPGSEPG